MLIQFRQGIVKEPTSGGNPAFLTTDGTNVSLVASAASPVLIDFSQGDVDYLFQETANVSPAWIGPFPSGTNYLYWDINLKTGVRTFGSTTFSPVVNANAPASPQNGQMWFNSTATSWYYYNFGSWNPCIRAFAGTFTNGTLVQYSTGSQVGINIPTYAGYILFDDNNNPIKKYQALNLGEFITTESPLASQFSQIENYHLESTINTATASGNIAQWQAICYTGPSLIGVYTCNTVLPPYGSGTPAIGVAPQNMASGTVQAFLQQGYITDLNSFNSQFTSAVVGSNVFVNSSGFLTPTPPTGGTIQIMGYVVSSQTLFISPQPAIAFG